MYSFFAANVMSKHARLLETPIVQKFWPEFTGVGEYKINLELPDVLVFFPYDISVSHLILRFDSPPPPPRLSVIKHDY